MADRFENDGPRPIIILALIIIVLLALGALFAAIRVFVIGEQPGIVREQGSVDAVFCRTADCEAAMLALFESAGDIRCAFYELDLPRTMAALDEADAHVLVFEENAEESAGRGFSTVGSTGLMHHKFCVLDGETVITGSMNPTVNAQERNDEHLVILRSRTLAAAYAREWDVLDGRARGDDGKKPRVDAPPVELSGIPVDVCFSPAEGCEADLVAAIDAANASIRFMTFSFTSDAVGDALVRAFDRGVAVEGVVERRQSDQWSEYDSLRLAGIPVLKDGNPGTMHHKVFVIDGKTVVTGSYNPTANANARNDENLLVIGDPVLAERYLSEYLRVSIAAK